MQRMLGIVTAVLLIGAGEPTEAAKDELSKLQGRWKLVAVEANGMASEIEEPPVVLFKDRQVHVNNVIEKTFTIDPTTEPHLIDFADASDNDKSQVLEGIYRFDGDKLHVCLFVGNPRKQRPTDFKTEAGDEKLTLILERLKEME